MGTSSLAGLGAGASLRPEFLPRPTVQLPPKANALNAPGRAHSDSVEFTQAAPEIGVNALLEALQALAERILQAFQSGTGEPDGEDQPSSSNVQSQQLEFSFFAEIRVEQLIAFEQRTSEIAQGLTGDRQANLVETSQRVAARFEFSLSVSATVLTEFANGAEALGDSPNLDEFLELTRQLLGELDEVLNAFFGELSGLFALGEDAQQFIDEISQAFAGFNGGSAQEASFSSVQLEFEFSFSVSIAVEGTVQQSDPITLDLDGDGIELSNYRSGAQFDITASGRIVQTAFVTGGDAFLALDRNGNGTIDTGAELFGDQRGAANGFAELLKFDSNRDNVIDRKDAAFDSLLLFRDNGNGKTETGELLTLAQAGIESLALDYLNTNQQAAGGNRIAQIASFTRTNGSKGTSADAILNYLA